MKVSLFITCLSDAVYPKVGETMARLLARYGVQLDFPKVQTCCGQPSYNIGYWDETRAAAKTILKAFNDSDFVVSPSGSCTYMIHHYPELFRDEPEWLDSARRLEQKTYEFTQFMVQVLGVTDVGASFPHTVTYHPSCHGSRLLGVKDEPMQLLGSVKNLKLVPLPFAEDCCGFGGTFAVKMPDISGAMVTEKVSSFRPFTKIAIRLPSCCPKRRGRSCLPIRPFWRDLSVKGCGKSFWRPTLG
jgi:L-lactate dehydrogenase complex protein LldE